MTWADAKDIAAVIQSLAIAAATLIGGGWALFRFLSLQSITKARLDLEKAKRELSQRGTLQVSLRAASISADLGKFIELRAAMSNVGNRTEVIDWGESITEARLLESVTDGVVSFSANSIQGQHPLNIANANVSPGETIRNAFIFPVLVPGLYFVTFLVKCSIEEHSLINEDLVKAGVEKVGFQAWGQSLFVNIPTSD